MNTFIREAQRTNLVAHPLRDAIRTLYTIDGRQRIEIKMPRKRPLLKR